VSEHDWLAKRFEESRPHLRAVAYRMLGSGSEADDAVQEAWLRLSRSETASIENLGGWLTTVVARVCLDMLRSREARREESLDPSGPHHDDSDAEHEQLVADSVGLALLVVLETLSPPERVSFVLHDMFDLPFEEIAPIVGRTPTAARQLASRARRRVQGSATVSGADLDRRRAIVEAFLAASRGGDFDALLELLDPDVVLRADRFAAQMGATKEVRGAKSVADTFAGRARVAQPALINGAPGLVWAPGGQPRVAFGFTIEHDKIVSVSLVADPETLGQLDLVMLDR
jgi:RNA polymerase sigma-70 factor (ECF subfamily)